MRRLEVEYARGDGRGSLTQVNTGGWKQFNYLKINKGQEFGGHYHKHKTELFYVVSGKAAVTVMNNHNDNTITLGPGEGIIIEPYDWHKLRAIEGAELVELLSEPYSKEDVWVE